MKMYPGARYQFLLISNSGIFLFSYSFKFAQNGDKDVTRTDYYAGVCIDNKLKSVMRSVGRRYKQAGGELMSLDRYAGTEDQLTYRETYFDPFQHSPEEIAIRHDHSQWIFYRAETGIPEKKCPAEPTHR